MSTGKKERRLFEFAPDYAVAPGSTLEEVIGYMGMSQKELATRTGLTEQTIIRILKGEQPITFDTANKLELVTGVPARFWNNYEMHYREQLSKIKQTKELGKSVEWLHSLPYKELIARGALKEVTAEAEMVQEACRFYGVSDVSSWNNLWCTPEAAAKRPGCFETQSGSASAWIRLGELQAQEIECEPFDKRLGCF